MTLPWWGIGIALIIGATVAAFMPFVLFVCLCELTNSRDDPEVMEAFARACRGQPPFEDEEP